jgi:hypothetical protein
MRQAHGTLGLLKTKTSKRLCLRPPENKRVKMLQSKAGSLSSEYLRRTRPGKTYWKPPCLHLHNSCAVCASYQLISSVKLYFNRFDCLLNQKAFTFGLHIGARGSGKTYTIAQMINDCSSHPLFSSSTTNPLELKPRQS